MASPIEIPRTVGDAAVNVFAHPLETLHRHVNYIGGKNNLHTTKRTTDLFKHVLELIVHTTGNLNYGACIPEFTFFSDLSKMLYAQDFAFKAFHYHFGDPSKRKKHVITDYSNLTKGWVRVKQVATIIMNISQAILFIGKYVVPKTYKALSSSYIHYMGRAGYLVAGEKGVSVANTVTKIGMKSLSRVSSIVFLSIFAYQIWWKVHNPNAKFTDEQRVVKILNSAEFIGKAATCTAAVLGFTGVGLILTSLVVDLIAVTGHNQAMLLHQENSSA